MAFTLDTTYTLFIENPNEKGTTLRIGKDGYSVERVEAEDGTRTFNISSLDGTLLYSGVKRIGLDQDNGEIVGMASWECRKVEVLETGYVITINSSSSTNTSIEEFVDAGGRIKTIAEKAFANFVGMKYLLLPKLKYIPKRAFERCSALEKITIPSTCQYIQLLAFVECTSLEEFVIEPASTSLILYSEPTSYSRGVKRTNITNLVTVTMTASGGAALPYGDEIISYSYSAWKVKRVSIGRVIENKFTANYTDTIDYTACAPFSNNKAINEVIMDCNIPPLFFELCSNMRKLTIREGVTEILGGTFRGCTSLLSITLPKSVVTIERAFIELDSDCEITCTTAQAEMITASGGFEGTFNIVDD